MSSLAVVVGEFFVVDAHAQEFFPESFPCDAKQFRGFALVAAGFVQHIKDEFALHFLQVVVLRRWRFLPRGICPIPADERFRLEKVTSSGTIRVERSESSTRLPIVREAARSISLFNSRTLPGQPYCRSCLHTAGESESRGRPI